jgi:hypothetical protein
MIARPGCLTGRRKFMALLIMRREFMTGRPSHQSLGGPDAGRAVASAIGRRSLFSRAITARSVPERNGNQI